MGNKHIVIGSFIVAALVILTISYFSRDEAKPSDNDVVLTGQTPTTTPSDSSVVEINEDLVSVKDNEDNSGLGSSERGKVQEPSITISPYSVYIGFATSVGTSSKSLMQKEVSEVVIGYEWEALPPSPMFSTITLPEWDASEQGQQKEYAVYIFDENSYTLLGSYTSSEDIKFPRDGLQGASRFKITGIDPALGICPGDRSFTWENVRFTFEGPLGLIRTPITQDLSSGETCHRRK